MSPTRRPARVGLAAHREDKLLLGGRHARSARLLLARELEAAQTAVPRDDMDAGLLSEGGSHHDETVAR